MYTPSSFKETDSNIAKELIQIHNFGILFSHHAEHPVATHIPFLIEEDGDSFRLITHMARANKQWRSFEEGKEVMAVFVGPHSYISPSWYKDRVTVPTWNYATVHVTGKVTLIHDEDKLREIVTDLTNYQESLVDSDWSLSEGESTIPIELKAIVGLSIEPTKVEAKFKFNQNRSEEDQKSVIEALKKSKDPNSAAIVEIMERNLRG